MVGEAFTSHGPGCARLGHALPCRLPSDLAHNRTMDGAHRLLREPALVVEAGQPVAARATAAVAAVSGVQREEVHELVVLQERHPPENGFDDPDAEPSKPAWVAHLGDHGGDVDHDAEDDRVEQLGDESAEETLAPSDEALATRLAECRQEENKRRDQQEEERE